MLRRRLLHALAALVALPLLAQAPRPRIDGPHVLWKDGTAEVLWSREGRLERTRLPKGAVLTLEGLPPLPLNPANPKPAAAELPLPDRVCALSDLHGNWEGAVALLKAHRVLRDDLRWCYGKGHLVVLGDVVDRGQGQTELLWLLRSLELQARRAGGRVHLLLGNHEVMVMRGDLRYLHAKYQDAWASLPEGVPALLGPGAELGRWLRSRPALLKLGETLFVHGGISPALAAQGLTLEAVNAQFRSELEAPGKPPLLGTDGPLWYRGFVPGADTRRPDATEADVDQALAAFGARRIVIGHTTQDRITALHRGKVVAVDAGLLEGRPGEVLLLERGKAYRGLPDGRREPLE